MSRSTAFYAAVVLGGVLMIGTAFAQGTFRGARTRADPIGRDAFRPDGPRLGGEVTARRQTATQVFLLRGLLNVFSLGMDDLAIKMQARGVRATVENHAAWAAIADMIIAERRAGSYDGPVILMGHSLGGDDAIRAAQRLGNAGIPVDLLVTFDPVSPDAVPANVVRAIDYYQRGNGFGQPLRPGVGFRGQLSNADLQGNRSDLWSQDLNHITLDKGARLHAEVIRAVLALGRRGHAALPVRPRAEAQ